MEHVSALLEFISNASLRFYGVDKTKLSAVLKTRESAASIPTELISENLNVIVTG